MQTKLTLRLDDALIAAAKSESKRRGKSLSKLVADYFGVFQANTLKELESHRLAPLTRSMVGILHEDDGASDSKAKGRYDRLMGKHSRHVRTRPD